MKRRAWLLSALGASGALLVGWSLLPPRSRLGSPAAMLPAEGEVALNGWIRIAADGSVVMAMPRSEMGQGIHTGLAMLVAEELELPLSRVRLEQAGSDRIYGNVAMLVAALPFHPLEAEAEAPPLAVRAGTWMVSKLARELGLNVTGGSSSMADAWEPLRLAAATVRASLLQAASALWKLPVAELVMQQGQVRHASGRQAHYGELAVQAAGLAPANVSPKPPAQWNLLGRAQPRTDAAAKSDGSARFGMDVRLPGMLHATVRMCPMLGGTLQRLDEAPALTLPGVLRVVPLKAQAGATAGFAVVATSTWAALRGAQALQPQWQQRSEGALDSESIREALLAQLQPGAGHVFHERGKAAQAEASAARVLQATYHAPYLAHATLEPMNCTARFAGGQLELWVPTQVPGFARDMAARVAGLDPERVQLHVTLLGGGFGRRLEADFVAQAVQLAMACEGQAVQLLWPREEDMGHDFYRPLHVARLQAAITPQGQVSSLRIQSAGDAISPRWLERVAPSLAGPVDTPDKTTAEGLFDLPYAFAHQHMAHVATRSGVPVGFWRSVGHSHNAFFSESFIDELAHATGQDPLAFRRALLADAPRYRTVLDLAAEKSGWGTPLPAGRARGLALHASFGSVVAQVAEVSLDAGQPRVHRVVCAVDCGTVVNPDSVAQQMEGSVAFALSAALYGRIDIRGGVVQQTQFSTYPVLRMDQMPEVQTWTVPSTRTPGGVGEPGVPPLAPALANALFVLTNKRHRSLPLQV